MNIIDAAAMESIASYADLVTHLHQSHLEDIDANDDLLMTQPATPEGTDTLLIRAAWQRAKQIGIKLITVFPANPTTTALPAIQAVYMLFDGNDGKPLATLDGTELTYWKTAADSALGAKLLSRENSEELLMVGAGAQAPHVIAAFCAVRPSIRRVKIWNRTAGKADALAAAGPVDGVNFESVADLEAATRSADIVSCATASEAPLVFGEWLRPGQHLDLIGGFKPEMVETDAEALKRSRVFVDLRATTLGVCGDFLKPIEAGQFSADAIEADLYELCRGGVPGGRGDDDITLFKNGGGGHLDLMTASYFVARATAA